MEVFEYQGDSKKGKGLESFSGCEKQWASFGRTQMVTDMGKSGKAFRSLSCCPLLYYDVFEATIAFELFDHCCSLVIDVLKCSLMTDFVVNLESQENGMYCAEKWESSGESD